MWASANQGEYVLRVNVLGEFEVYQGDELCTPTAPKPRKVLALLALRANQVVRTGQLIEELWEEHPPPSAQTTLQTYIYFLRKCLAGPDAAKRMLRTTPAGYVLAMEEFGSDHSRFVRIVDEARSAYQQGRVERASQQLRDALALWRGPALGDLPCGPLLDAHSIRLEERRIDALQLRVEADLMLGRHREVIGELKSLIAHHRYDEWFHAKLMLALHRSGRRNEALDVYQRLRVLLDRELGLEPSAEVQHLQREVITAGG